MRPTDQELSECYKFVTDVMGKINDQGGISVETAGHFKDLVLKIGHYFVNKHVEELIQNDKF